VGGAQPPAVQAAEGMFKDPDVAAFVDAGASVSAKTFEPQRGAPPNSLDTMLQGTDLTKPKLSIEIPTEVLQLQAQRKELAQRKYALLADPPPLSQEQAGNKKAKAQAAKMRKNNKNTVRPPSAAPASVATMILGFEGSG
jgi:hypothetical protein